ncbi:unnamed protein product [Dibothriocephalus latus]|uniref:Uncharacterized protein n=1 Tax=Dibothriocephalus latus TaxID=60516 RepID=A0A3P7M0K4_DIBLA|nr:unnamed protein product [Dibothriocephalus latus]
MISHGITSFSRGQSQWTRNRLMLTPRQPFSSRRKRRRNPSVLHQRKFNLLRLTPCIECE